MCLSSCLYILNLLCNESLEYICEGCHFFLSPWRNTSWLCIECAWLRSLLCYKHLLKYTLYYINFLTTYGLYSLSSTHLMLRLGAWSLTNYWIWIIWRRCVWWLMSNVALLYIPWIIILLCLRLLNNFIVQLLLLLNNQRRRLALLLQNIFIFIEIYRFNVLSMSIKTRCLAQYYIGGIAHDRPQGRLNYLTFDKAALINLRLFS